MSNLFDCIKFEFDESISSAFPECDLNHGSWYDYIHKSVMKLDERYTGNMLITKLISLLKDKKKLIITNKPLNNNIYPSCHIVNENTIKIVIPNVPYWVSVPTLKNIEHDVSDVSFQSLVNINKYICVSSPLDLCGYDYSQYIEWINMPKFLEIANLLIRTLRYFEGYDVNNVEEEYNVIYGLDKGVLKYIDGGQIDYITENMIRKEWGLSARLSHNSKDVFIYNVPHTFENKNMFSAKYLF